jgi:hypothetical protein
LRNDFRHFRVDRIQTSQALDKRFSADSAKLAVEWLALRRTGPAPRLRPQQNRAELGECPAQSLGTPQLLQCAEGAFGSLANSGSRMSIFLPAAASAGWTNPPSAQ